PYLDNTDNQQISLAGNILTLGNGTGADTTVDLSGYISTDDQALSLVGNTLTLEDGGTVDLAPFLDNTDTQDLSIDATGKIISLVDGGSVTINADDADADPTNELSDLNLAANILTLTNPATGGNQVDLSSYVNTDTQDLSIDATGKIISLVDGGSVTINADDADSDPTNERNTAFAVGGGNLNITDSGGTLSVPLASLGTDDQTITAFSMDAANILTITLEDGNTRTVDLSSLNNSGTDDQTLTLVGNNLSIESGNTVVLPTADGTETKVNAGANVTVTGNGSTASPYVVSVASLNDADSNPSNELQTISRTGSDVTLSNGGGTVSINDEDSVVGNEYNTNFAVSGTDLVITDGGGARAVPLASLGSDDQKIDKFVLNGTTLELSMENDGEADKTVNLNGTFATDAELAASDAADLDKVVGNEVTNATDATLVRSGSGTTASPYTLDVATGGITTTEILNGTIATIDLADNSVTSGKIVDGTVATVDLANSSVTSAKIVDGTIAAVDIASTGNNKVLTTSAAGIVEWIDKSALVPTTTVSNTSATNTLTTTVNGVTGAGVNIINSNALSLAGSNLTSTVNGVASAPLNLSSFLDNTDDQTAAEVNVVTPVDVDGDATTEGTVEEVIQDIAPIVSKAARIFYPPSIAVDASTNGTFTIDLYAQYIAQYGSPTVGSVGAPAALPTYTSAELYYYVTYADPTVFNTGTMSIDATGKLTYTIIGQPSDYNALINVVFVVK
ncbi:beta strand repeat-containing protein, partial [Sediminicola sp. 1XM1-17]|uniref:beta strand repeat-containing protein n=1 Tax=Sediminicola sp. 1XM1-17 TaxID=3127702 RepID=UPI003077A6B1